MFRLEQPTKPVFWCATTGAGLTCLHSSCLHQSSSFLPSRWRFRSCFRASCIDSTTRNKLKLQHIYRTRFGRSPSALRPPKCEHFVRNRVACLCHFLSGDQPSETFKVSALRNCINYRSRSCLYGSASSKLHPSQFGGIHVRISGVRSLSASASVGRCEHRCGSVARHACDRELGNRYPK
jgi:hypothetical protein